MRKSKKALIYLFFISVACSTKTVYKPEPFYIAIPETKQEIINIESKLTTLESLYEKDVLFFEKWKDKKGVERYTIRKEYLDAHFESVKLKNKYIQELEAAINNNNDAIKTRKVK